MAENIFRLNRTLGEGSVSDDISQTEAAIYKNLIKYVDSKLST